MNLLQKNWFFGARLPHVCAGVLLQQDALAAEPICGGAQEDPLPRLCVSGCNGLQAGKPLPLWPLPEDLKGSIFLQKAAVNFTVAKPQPEVLCVAQSLCINKDVQKLVSTARMNEKCLDLQKAKSSAPASKVRFYRSDL